MSAVPRKSARIAFCLDERLSRERNNLLTRKINALRRFAEIHLISGEVNEEQLLKRLEEQNYQLVIAPWDRYLVWSRVEAFYGLMRTSGPTFAGYCAEPLSPTILGEPSGKFRSILLDFHSLNTHALSLLIRSLLHDHARTGIRPLLDPGTEVFCESWLSNQGLGNRLDAVLTLPGVLNSGFAERANSIRIALCALWSLIYEEGPGKGELRSGTAKAYFQVGVDSHALVMRLCYSLPSFSPVEALRIFWPAAKKTTAPTKLLTRYCDLVRVHTIPEAADVELTVAFFPSSRGEDDSEPSLQSLWIEPVAAKLVTEVPFEAPGPNTPHLSPLPSAPTPLFRQQSAAEPKILEDERERFILHAARKILEVKRLLAEKDELIRDLRSGGVGTAHPLPPPDAEGLLDAFQERYFEARYEISQFELQILEMEKSGATFEDIEELRQKMKALAHREETWIKRLVKTLEIYRSAKKRA